jgi:hypothetical protein
MIPWSILVSGYEAIADAQPALYASRARIRGGTVPPHEPAGGGTWTCRGCPTRWPCYTARRSLLIEYGDARAALGAYLGLCLAHALDDLPHASPSELYARFLGWVPRHPG